MAWAIFADKTDGRQFFFATAHTEPGQSKAKRALRKKQAKKILAEIEAENRDNLPIVLTGDFSSTKLTAVNPVYDVLTDSGSSSIRWATPGSRSRPRRPPPRS